MRLLKNLIKKWGEVVLKNFVSNATVKIVPFVLWLARSSRAFFLKFASIN